MKGHLHPTTLLTAQIVNYFRPYGFELIQGPEIETEENNFDLLNIPADHPARDEHDTFYLKHGGLLRTHTSPMQIRVLRQLGYKPPLRILIPGRAYRNEATDSTHETNLYQVEGLVIDQQASMSTLKGMLEGLLKSVFPPKTEVRFRPGSFPFVEPGMEVDIKTPSMDWNEVLGAGMVHPSVLKNMGLDPQTEQGFAFGIGIERLNRLITGIEDIRLNYTGDYRYLGQTDVV